MYQYEVTCESCGTRWRVFADDEPEAAECIACGATTYQVSLVGTRFTP